MPTPDNTPLTPEQQALAASDEAMSAVWYWYGRYVRRYRNVRDEIESAAFLSVVKAVRDYDPARCKLGSYLSYRVQKGIIDCLRDCGVVTRKARRAGVRHVEMSNLTVRDRVYLLSNNSAPPEAATLGAVGFDSLVKPLRGNSRRAVVWHFRDGVKLKAIGEALGLTESRVSQLIASALDFLRESHAADYHAVGSKPRLQVADRPPEAAPAPTLGGDSPPSRGCA